MLCFVLALLNSHPLCTSHLSHTPGWKQLRFFFSRWEKKLCIELSHAVIFIWVSVETPPLHSVLNTLLTIKYPAASRGFYFSQAFLPFWRHLEAHLCLSVFWGCLQFCKSQSEISCLTSLNECFQVLQLNPEEESLKEPSLKRAPFHTMISIEGPIFEASQTSVS